jgi:thioredoxin 2
MANDTALLRCMSCKALNRVPVKKLTQNPLCGKCKALLDFPFQAVTATAASFDQELASWLETVLVVFWAKGNDLWKKIEPAVADIAFAQAGRLKVIKVDLDAEPGLALLFSIQTAPTFLTFRDSKQLGRLDGTPREAFELAQWVQASMS